MVGVWEVDDAEALLWVGDSAVDTSLTQGPNSSRARNGKLWRISLGVSLLFVVGFVAGITSDSSPSRASPNDKAVNLFGLPAPPAFNLPWQQQSAPSSFPSNLHNNGPMTPAQKPPADGPKEMNFYMYRAGGPASYDLENVNTASLEGTLWYLHSEVVTSAPRKYGIDRIRRYQVRVHNTWELWNIHKKQFGPFMAFDAGKCTTTDHGTDICDAQYRHYGFIVGCQPVAKGTAAYLESAQSTTACEPGSDDCRLPIWYSLPGECPSMGIPQDDINANMAKQDVSYYKTEECRSRMPGGRCDEATGAPDCTYSVFPAGEVYLNELSGIDDYNYFWNASYEICIAEFNQGRRTEPCEKQVEYDTVTDKGVGTAFWDGRMDPASCQQRVDFTRNLFETNFPGVPGTVDTPVCDFDMFYDDEWTWAPNHDKAEPSQWWDYNSGGAIPDDIVAKFRTPAPTVELQPAPGSTIPPELVPTPEPVQDDGTGYGDEYAEDAEAPYGTGVAGVDPALGGDAGYADPALGGDAGYADPALGGGAGYADPAAAGVPAQYPPPVPADPSDPYYR